MAPSSDVNSFLLMGVPSYIQATVAIACLAWIIKRISWRNHPFFCDPRCPPFVPYMIPFYGSAKSFIADPLQFINYWTSYFNSSIFCAYIAGNNIVFVLDPIVASHVNSRIKQLSWRKIKGAILHKAFLVSEDGSKTVVNNTDDHAVYDKLLMKNDSLEQLNLKIQEVMERKFSEVIPENNNDWSSKSIMSLFCKIIYLANTEILVGFPELNTDESFESSMALAKDIVKFARGAREQKKLKESHDAREKLGAIFQKHIKDAKQAPFLKETSQMYDSKVSPEDEAYLQFATHWATYTNAVPSMFWLVYNLLCYKGALPAIRKEVRSIYNEKTRSEQDICNFTLEDLNRMVHLDSLVLETFRLTTTHLTFRRRIAEEDFELKVDNKDKVTKFSVKKGTLFLTCPTFDHRDEEVFEDALTFKWDRFVPGADGKALKFFKNGRRLTRPVNPFGGGPTICPGRRFATTEMKAMVATFLIKYDIRFRDDVIPDPPEKLRSGYSNSMAIPASDVGIEVRKLN